MRVLSRLFRRLFLEELQTAFEVGKLSFFGDLAHLVKPRAFARLLAEARRPEWVVYAKPPFGGPEQVLAYLGRYTHRVAIANSRLIVVGDVWLAGNVGFYAQGARPSAYVDADPAAAPWLDDAAVRERGALVLWTSDKRGRQAIPLERSSLAGLAERFPDLVELEPIVVEARWLGGSAPVIVGIALIPPRGGSGS